MVYDWEVGPLSTQILESNFSLSDKQCISDSQVWFSISLRYTCVYVDKVYLVYIMKKAIACIVRISL